MWVGVRGVARAHSIVEEVPVFLHVELRIVVERFRISVRVLAVRLVVLLIQRLRHVGATRRRTEHATDLVETRPTVLAWHIAIPRRGAVATAPWWVVLVAAIVGQFHVLVVAAA